jgi:hypothetical protein
VRETSPEKYKKPLLFMGWPQAANRVVRVAFGERPPLQPPSAPFGDAFHHRHHLEKPSTIAAIWWNYREKQSLRL